MRKFFFAIFTTGLLLFSHPDLYAQKTNRTAPPPRPNPAVKKKKKSPFEEALTPDGKLDLSKLSEELPEQLIDKMKKSDENKDGFLDFKERQKAFKLGMKPKEGAPGLAPRPSGPGRNLFAQAKRADGSVDLSKIPRDIPVDEWNHIRSADLDGDGLLSKTEQEIAFQKRTHFPSPMIQQGPGSRSDGKSRSHSRKGGKDKPNSDPFQEARMEDGRIDLAKISQDIPARFLDRINKADTNQDGYLDPEEQKALKRENPPGTGPIVPGDPAGDPTDSSSQEDSPAPLDSKGIIKMGGPPLIKKDQRIETKGDTPNDHFVFIPANPDFQFESNSRNDGRGEKAPILKNYCLAKYPVSNEEYAQFIKETKHDSIPSYWKDGSFPKGKAKHPVVQISLKDAEAYCRWMNSKYPGWIFRIPTEAEWENAASGPRHLAYPWGNLPDTRWEDHTLYTKFNYNGYCASFVIQKERESASLLTISSNGSVTGWKTDDPDQSFLRTDDFKKIVLNGGLTTAVDQYKEGSSPYGCFDMAGNSSDWTNSILEGSQGSEGRKIHVVRGGSWYSNQQNCSCTFRGEGRFSDSGYITVGFRLAASQ